MLTIEKPKTLYKGGTKATGLKSVQVGEKVRYHRLQRGLSQQELADGLCSVQLISAIERGTNNPRVKTLEMIADRLNVPLKEIYQPDEDEFPNRVKLQLVKAYIKRGEYEPAQELLTELKAQGNFIEVESQDWHLLQGELFNKTNQPKEAIELLHGFITQIEKHQNADDELLCNLYNQLGTGYFKLRQFAKAYSAYKRGYQVALRFPAFETTAANVTYNLGIVCNQLELLDEAKVFLDEAREYYESISNLKFIADAYFELAYSTKSEAYVQKALNLYESLDAMKMASLVRQFHAIYIKSKIDFNEALSELEGVAVDFSNDGDPGRALYALSYAVLLCVEKSELQIAENLLIRAESYREIVGETDSYNLAPYYRAIAAWSLGNKDFEQCIRHAEKSSDLYAIMDMNAECADSLEFVVEAYQQQGKHEEACAAARKANVFLRKTKGV